MNDDVRKKLIKNTNEVRRAYMLTLQQLDNANEEIELWKSRLRRVKKLNRKQKRLIRKAFMYALQYDKFSEENYSEAMDLLKWL